MFPTPSPQLFPNTLAYESQPMVKPTGFREYDARWLFEKEINLMGVQALGLGLARLLKELGVPREVVVGQRPRAADPRLDRGPVAFGEQVTRNFFSCGDGRMHERVLAEHVLDRAPERLAGARRTLVGGQAARDGDRYARPSPRRAPLAQPSASRPRPLPSRSGPD